MNWRRAWPNGARIEAGKLGWVTGEFGLASYTAVSSIYLLFYATDVLRIPPTWEGLALLIPRIWNIVGDPIVGFVSDRTHTRCVFLLNNTGLTLYQVPYSAMLAELTSDPAERTKLVA